MKNNFELDKSLNVPKIFTTKINKVIYKPLQYVFNDTGKTRHYPPAAQEWFNSIYNYNKNFIKTLPVLDKTLMNILKSYFNMSTKEQVKGKRKVIVDRFRRLSSKKAFVGKGELKHTNSKVMITLYLFDVKKMHLMRELKRNFKLLFSIGRTIKIALSEDRKDKDKLYVSYSRPFNLREFLRLGNPSLVHSRLFPLKWRNIVTYREVYLSNIESFINKRTSYLDLRNQYYKYLSRLVAKKLLNSNEKFLLFRDSIKYAYASRLFSFKYPIRPYDENLEIAEKCYKSRYIRSLFLLKSHLAKYELFLSQKLGYIVKNMYNKEVEFNVVDLNQMHLNSDIFTQAIALKLKNRKNRLFRVLKTSLRKVDLPNVSRRNEKYFDFNRDNLLENKIRNSYISSMFDNNKISNRDSLNKLLLDLFKGSDNLEADLKFKSKTIKWPMDLETYVIKSLKHLKLAGVRVEGKGRLTKRFTASKSVFKMRWKGGLKNVDSSFKGLSAVMLRGIVKSNVQYSLIHSKTRIGAFGVKGWVASK